MPTYLVHGFRWQRASIRIHIILQDLEDAAAEWVVAPATSLTILNSFYRMYDFLPPSNPPSANSINGGSSISSNHPPRPSYPPPPPPPAPFFSAADFPPPPPIPDDDPYHMPDEHPPPRKSLSKKNTRSMISLRSLARRQKSSALPPSPTQSPEHHRPPTARPATSRSHAPTHTRQSISLRIKKEKVPSFNDWSAIKLLEQYDPSDMYSVSQPYAYVADHMVEVTLGASLAEEISKYESKMRNEEMPDSPVSADPEDLARPNGTTNGHGNDYHAPGMNGAGSANKKGQPGWFEKLRDGLQAGCEIGWYVVVCGDEERAPPPPELRGMHSARPSMTSDGSLSVKAPRNGGFRSLFRKRLVVEE
jgi:hypothetical protein